MNKKTEKEAMANDDSDNTIYLTTHGDKRTTII